MTIAVVAEKPAVARDIAAVLGASRRTEGALEGGGYVVTWAIGHLVGLGEPHDLDPSWKAWRLDLLPMLPRRWSLKVLEGTREHFARVQEVLARPDVEQVVCATDAGREGELIFRYLYRQAGCRKPVRRLWISSLTPDAIRAGFSALRPGRDFDPLAAAAEGRSQADWLVGMNLSRFYTLRHGPDLLSVGRVQTPTLALLAARERAIQEFVPEKYCEVVGTFGQGEQGYPGVWFDPARVKEEGELRLAQRLPPDGAEAEAIRARCLGKPAVVASLEGVDRSLPPPLLYDLTELQRHANRLYGLTAKATLETAQSLYEKHKLLSYPRTDSRHLSQSVAATLLPVVAAIAPAYGTAVAAGTGQRPLGRRYVDDAKVSDHHAVIPTGVSREGKTLTRDEERVYDLVSRRLLMAWHADHKTRVTRAVTVVDDDHFRSTGTVVTQLGWKALDPVPLRETRRGKGDPEREEDRALPAGLTVGQTRPTTKVEVEHKQTQPPRRYTDATLLTAMESAGKTLDDAELEEAMRERGLGTPATRAAILETLLQREYVVRVGKALQVTERGLGLIGLVDERVKSPSLTGEWERALKRLERGEGTLAGFMEDIERFVVDVIGRGRQAPASSLSPPTPPAISPQSPPGPSARDPSPSGHATLPERRPVRGSLEQVLKARFGHPAFRPFQEEVCQAVADGADALLVMPTGSGKSLCYQLPGVARGGTTLVISPLIALMEDQTAKLQALGFAAERIHSNRTREALRAACRAYLDGRLDFLAIAPERLSVPGFPEMLAKRPPTLVAVDEAHCISHWGHDFRPDYRLLGGRLPMLRPAPVLALTATATVRVQDDIVAQLGIPQARRFIRGFRRDNLAIEVVERTRGERLDEIVALLAPPERRPAIVYVPSRKLAEQVAEELARRHRAAPYHAGLDGRARAATQEQFQAGRLEVVVATIAFGMGIDKADVRTVVHLAMPGTVEGYYQEIGRAGRDGKPSRAVLFHGWGDRMVHESFLERDYPGPEVLAGLRDQVPPGGVDRTALLAGCRLPPEAAEPALDKLWVHGGVVIGDDDVVRPGHDGWRKSYLAIKQYRLAQLEEMQAYVQSSGCRMTRLLRHFGDTRDSRPCGHCDACAPDGCVGRSFRAPTAQERSWAARIVDELSRFDGQSTGTLFKALFPAGDTDRKVMDRLLDALARAKVLTLVEDAFEKDGKTIRFRRARLTPMARPNLASDAFVLDEQPEPVPKEPRRKVRKGKGKGKPERSAASRAPSPSADPVLEKRLRDWRLGVAKARRIPAFRILTDRTLQAIAAARPRSMADLAAVGGIGPKLADKYGTQILSVVGEA